MQAEPESVRRIVLIGAECTGKSTLARALAEELCEPWSREYVRLHVDQLDRPLDESDLEPIARGQLSLEDEAFAKASRYVIHDTNLLSSIVYSEHYYKRQVRWAEEAFAARTYWRYFLCQPDIPWEADPGQREGPEAREALQREFVSALEGRSIPYVSLSGSVRERLVQVLRCCDMA